MSRTSHHGANRYRPENRAPRRPPPRSYRDDPRGHVLALVQPPAARTTPDGPRAGRPDVELADDDVIVPMKHFCRVRKEGGVTLVTELSDLTAIVGRRIDRAPDSLVVEGDTATVRFYRHTVERNHEGEVAGYRYIPDVKCASSLRMPCDLLVIND